MGKYAGAFSMLKESLFGSDLLILMFGIIEFALFLITIAFAWAVNRDLNNGESASKFACRTLEVWYTIFTIFISIFPLLGMLGTVLGLLGLDLSAGDMTNIKENFFLALTSTAWGIIFSVIYKVLHALSLNFIEEQIDAAKNWLEECKK